MALKIRPFWMIQGIGKDGVPTRPPTVRHGTQAAALSEAERLAAANPGIAFVVLESVAAVRRRDVEVESLGRGPRDPVDDEIPF
ncbi:hypothetical protein [Methylobacterium aquaticum]|jgi:hypothetical protein|uniref:Uncharacterized protein n=1 Tax=Methylobacterium aquaticum TaxID=270351 RepID=A0A0J6UR57_9HYPH|nr:hypothetical protein [Methylobacterium aquaticum]KMO28551.1 hypothetical protein VP06_27130 [Methylobacterium aquaticum]